MRQRLSFFFPTAHRTWKRWMGQTKTKRREEANNCSYSSVRTETKRIWVVSKDTKMDFGFPCVSLLGYLSLGWWVNLIRERDGHFIVNHNKVSYTNYNTIIIYCADRMLNGSVVDRLVSRLVCSLCLLPLPVPLPSHFSFLSLSLSESWCFNV